MRKIIMASRLEIFQKMARIGVRTALLIAGLIFSVLSAEAQTNYAAAYTFTTLAGVAGSGNVDGAGSDAQFQNPGGVALDKANNLYVADTANQTIRKIM